MVTHGFGIVHGGLGFGIVHGGLAHDLLHHRLWGVRRLLSRSIASRHVEAYTISDQGDVTVITWAISRTVPAAHSALMIRYSPTAGNSKTATFTPVRMLSTLSTFEKAQYNQYNKTLT